ncbi:tetratricopeptide repeat protein [Gloeobacter kilaueensis]|uniref:TPR repeat-containing protein n=1 Tax=Gloeobacter kilaueensis (strain ATCC BAA-2537 / CCAP 1431/1 / ULC 316 / JS1) TaxID=1183438 RepID=U5QN31_GLOK1|nr:tetratricopeptide repeat protein [Gloeobacter kilaueensis]AGY59090.1 TPR repeat-containing protein [Gloeobacter kilaueensis JS1]
MGTSKGFGKPSRSKAGGRSAQPSSLRRTLDQARQFMQSGQLQQAGTLYQQVLQAQPDEIEALFHFAVVLIRSNQPGLAGQLLARVTALQPDWAEGHYMLANAFVQQRQPVPAEASFRQAIALKPDLAEAHSNLGLVLMGQNRFAEAAASLRQTIALRPEAAEGHYNLAGVLLSWAELEPLLAEDLHAEAGACMRRAIALRPNLARAHTGLGSVLVRQGQLAEAEAACRLALTLDPKLAKAHNDLGYALAEQGRFAEALECYEHALALDPNDAQAHCNRACLRLLKGDLAAGFAEHEWRWRLPNRTLRPSPPPAWDGSDLAGQTILLYPEAGLGDTLQFVRYAALLHRQGAKVIVECQPPLKSLLARVPGIDAVYAEGEVLPAFAVHAPLMSLPYRLGTTSETVPAAIPYIGPPTAPPPKADRFAPLLTTDNRCKIGLVWSAGPHGRRKRSFALALFEPLLDSEQARFFSLYKGEQISELAAYQDRVTDLGSHFTDFADTAWAIDKLDLVIAVDTSVAHLAGAMGKPVWIVLSYVPDWRWLLDRTDSPWYPTARLFRQPVPGNWQGAIAQVVAALTAFCRR